MTQKELMGAIASLPIEELPAFLASATAPLKLALAECKAGRMSEFELNCISLATIGTMHLFGDVINTATLLAAVREALEEPEAMAH